MVVSWSIVACLPSVQMVAFLHCDMFYGILFQNFPLDSGDSIVGDTLNQFTAYLDEVIENNTIEKNP